MIPEVQLLRREKAEAGLTDSWDIYTAEQHQYDGKESQNKLKRNYVESLEGVDTLKRKEGPKELDRIH
jgi:hypothetical protein